MWKWGIYILILLSVTEGLYGQTSSSKIISQYMLSINRSAEKSYVGDEVQNQFGFGVGIYSIIWKEGFINIVPGVEYNQTRLLDKDVIIGHFYSYEDLTYIRNCISIPVNVRFNVLRDQGLFVEAGAFWDWVVFARQKGVLHSYIPDANWEVHHRYTDVNEKVNLQNSLGYSIGLGVRINGSPFDFLIKPEYRHNFAIGYPSQMEPIGSYWKLNAGILFH